MKRAGHLARRVRLERRTPIKKRRERDRRSSRVVDGAYLDEVRRMPCRLRVAAPWAHHCSGEVQAHHHTAPRGLGQKASDRQALPLCRAAHNDLHAGAGFFRGMDKAARREWQDRQVEETQREVERRRERGEKAKDFPW